VIAFHNGKIDFADYFGLYGLIGCRIGCVELPVRHAQAVRGITTVDRLAAESTGDCVLRGIPGGNGHYTVAEGGIEPGNIIIQPLIGGIDDGCREGRIGTKGDVELERRLKPQQETGTVGCCSHIGIDRESGAAFRISIGIGGGLKGGRAKGGGDSLWGVVGLLASGEGGP
jgi:hypothetical protein